MDEIIIDIIAYRISQYTFINSDGVDFKTDGYGMTEYFLQDLLTPLVDKYVEENYEIRSRP